MFKTARMKKFRVVFPQKKRDAVVARLHEAGVVQLREISEPELARKALNEELSQLSPLLAKFKDMGQFLGKPVKGVITVKELALEQTLKLAKKNLSKLEPRVAKLKEKSDQLSKESQDLMAEIGILERFGEIRFPLEYLRSTDEVKVTLGCLDEEQIEGLFAAAKEALEQRVLTWAIGTGEIRTVILACRARDYQKLLPVLYRYEVEILDLPCEIGSPSAAIKGIKKQLAQVEKQRRDLERGVRVLASAKGSVVFQIVELLEIQKERLECNGLFGHTEATVVIEGWVKAKEAPDIESLLDSLTQGHQVFHAQDPAKDEVEVVPVELQNPKVVEDFEFVTGMYGLARYDEIDPTPFLSGTFALFFAITLSDAGYGIVLGLFMGSGVWLAKMFPRKLRRIMSVCAIFSVVVGVLIGGWFGFGGGLWVNPVQRPVPLLKLVIFIGIIHLLMAYGLAGALKDIFRRDWSSLVLNRISPILVVIGFFGLSFCVLGIGMYEFGINFSFPKMELFSAFNPLEPAGTLVTGLRAFFYIGLIVGVTSAVLTAKDVKGKIGGPINFIYGITGYIADVASYTRLLALGLAGSVIALAINLILALLYQGLMPKELTPFSAVYAAVVLAGLAFMFIVAHSFNIFISSLGGFIHTMRLHFAEFFGKFYESGGEKFTPFKVKRRFTKVKGGELLGG